MKQMKTIMGKKAGKKFLIGLFILIFAGLAILLGINHYIKATAGGQIVTPEQASAFQADCVLVLGAGVRSDGSPSPMLQDRLSRGLELYEMGASDRLLMSGDHGSKRYDEVGAMKQFAVSAGVPSECVFMDHAGFSTYESLYRARDVFQASRIVIVTQKYHLYRALYVADRLGLQAVGVSCEEVSYGGQELRELRETLARVKDFFYVLAEPKPTYLGQAIPVSGDGDATND